MEWIKLNQLDSEIKYNKLIEHNFNSTYILSNIESPIEKKMRFKLTTAYDEVVSEINKGIASGELKTIKKKYYTDIFFGIELYKILKNSGFKFHDGAENDIWRYLSVVLVPDIVYERRGDAPQSFYSINNRIWLKTIWWYCMLSLQMKRNEEGKLKYDFTLTKKMLIELNTDYILNIVDRAGMDGFRVSLIKELIKEFYLRKDEINEYLRLHKNVEEREIPRAIMTLNTARLNVYEPTSYEGGVKGYVEDLFNYILKTT